MKTLALLFFTAICSAGNLAFADTFTADVNHSEITLDDSVSLKLELSVAADTSAEEPVFDAPDFDVINEFTSTFYSQTVINGSLETKHSVQYTRVLKPKRAGTLKISGIQVIVAGKKMTAPDLEVRVETATGGTSPPQGYGGSGVGLRGTAKGKGKNFFLRAEVNKQKVYKGEQVLVTYYLYRRVQIANVQVDKFPTLNGFLREELEMQVLSPNPTTERVMLDGVAYNRTPLVRYAAYPLKEGKLIIDSMLVKFNYFAPTRSDDDDPFMQFFGRMTPLSGTAESDVLQVEAEALPDAGKPADFSGGVGDFDLSAAIDKTEVKTGEPITLTLKVEGRGNVASIEDPKPAWPENIEQYESKGHAKSSQNGVGTKLYEYLLIPRATGKMSLPPIELSYFDPNKKTYIHKSTQPIEINVIQGAPGSETKQAKPTGPLSEPAPAVAELRYLKPPGSLVDGSQLFGQPLSRLASWLCTMALIYLLLVIGSDAVRSRIATKQQRKVQNFKRDSKSWERLTEVARKAKTRDLKISEVFSAYEAVCGVVYDALDEAYQLGARAVSREGLERILVREKGLPEVIWTRISKLLEYAEMARFAGTSNEVEVRADLERWVTEGRHLQDAIRRRSS